MAEKINDLDGDRRNFGQLLNETAKNLDVTPRQLLEHYSRNEKQLDLMVMMGKDFDAREKDNVSKSAEFLAAQMRAEGNAPVPTQNVYTGPH